MLVAGCCVQDDIVHASLTVEENLLFSARYRLPSTMTHAEHLLSVERTIQACLSLSLSLACVAHPHMRRKQVFKHNSNNPKFITTEV